MENRTKRIALAALVVVILCGIMTPCFASAQVGVGASPSKINFGSVAKESVTSSQLHVYNLGNTSNQFNLTSNNSAVTISPATGSIGAKGNVSATITLTAPDKEGAGSATIHVAQVAKSGTGKTQVLPALDVRVTYTVTNQTASPTASSGGISPAIAAVMIVIVGLAVVAAYLMKRKWG